MRIVSGLYGGRTLKVPENNDIRPTTDKVRGAIFNILQSRGAVQGVRVLDAFCGSGALGLEALSRGAAWCTFMDKSRQSLALAQDNAATFGVENANFIARDALKPMAADAPYELVFLDPPYHHAMVEAALEGLHRHDAMADGAYIVCESERRYDVPAYDCLTHEVEKIYGQVKVSVFRYRRNDVIK